MFKVLDLPINNLGSGSAVGKKARNGINFFALSPYVEPVVPG